MTATPGRALVDRPTIRERARAPEAVASALSLLVVAVALMVGPARGAPPAPVPSPSGSAPASASQAPQPTPGVDPTVVAVVTTVNDRLTAIGGRLDELARAASPSAADIATTIRELSATARNGRDLIPQLARQPGAGPVADQLASLYQALGQGADAALQVTLKNAGAYKEAAAGLVVVLGDLPELQAAVQALLLVPGPDGSPTPGPSASAPPTEPATASASPPASASPDQSTAPSPSVTLVPGGPELLADGSFDAGVGLPWRLAVEPGATATVTPDGAMVVSAPTAARIDVATDTASRSAIALQQPGMPIEAGATYLLRVQLAASFDREVVMRVASTAGVTYGARIVTVTPAWAGYELVFTAPIGDPGAVVTLELGRSTATVWVDDASFREVTADFQP
jgi:hypothetical protein